MAWSHLQATGANSAGGTSIATTFTTANLSSGSKLIALVGVAPLARGGWFGIVDVFGCAAVMTYTALANMLDDNAVLGGSLGWGVILTVVASVLLAGLAVLAAVRRLRPPRADEAAEPEAIEAGQTKYESLSQNQS